MTPQCSMRGCRCAATHEIEIRGLGAGCSVYYCCDEHLPPWDALMWGVDRVRRLPGAVA